MGDWNPIRLTAMYHRHVEHGASIAERYGWRMPARYTSPEEEIAQLRETVGLCDISSVGKLSLQGEGIDSLLRSTVFGSEDLAIGRVRCQLSNEDSMDAAVVLARLSSDEVLFTTTAGVASNFADSLDFQSTECVHVVDITSALAATRIVGPMSRELLAAVTELDMSLDVFPDLSCAQGKFAGIYGVIVRQDIGDLPAYVFYFGREFGAYMWDSLLEAGEDKDLVLCGFEALEHLRNGVE